MSSVQHLRDFIRERLTATAEDISSEAEKTMVQYEEEISCQRRLLDISRKPETKLHITAIPKQHEWKEEEGLLQQVCIPGGNSSLDQEDPGHPEIKEEPEELYTSQEGEHLILKEETDTFMVTSSYEESEPNSDQLLSHNCPEPESRGEEESKYVGSGSTRCADLLKHQIDRSHISRVNDSQALDSQRKTDTSKKSVKCDTCGKTFQCKSNLTKHLRTHTGEKPHSCSICGKGFSQMANLKTHMRIHTGEKPHSCNTCGKRFSHMITLKTHVQNHTGDKPHSCNTCGKRFSRMIHLKTHIRIHTGERPHSCSTCGKRFSQKSTLETHVRIHTGEKPHSCAICGKRFSQMANLKRHMGIHTG
uniref:C2H2-type domain-containing protein n=1 Tax=Oreochromis aureus TaxID=47969 RepID=A0AAZ1XX34_OREAU